jgi:hypothetical protein
MAEFDPLRDSMNRIHAKGRGSGQSQVEEGDGRSRVIIAGGGSQ